MGRQQKPAFRHRDFADYLGAGTGTILVAVSVDSAACRADWFLLCGHGVGDDGYFSQLRFFMYYFTLVITPMVLLCGVFFPVTQLPPLLQTVSAFLPLTHAIELVRPLLLGTIPKNILLHLVMLFAYGSTGFVLALGLTRRRLLK